MRPAIDVSVDVAKAAHVGLDSHRTDALSAPQLHGYAALVCEQSDVLDAVAMLHSLFLTQSHWRADVVLLVSEHVPPQPPPYRCKANETTHRSNVHAQMSK